MSAASPPGKKQAKQRERETQKERVNRPHLTECVAGVARLKRRTSNTIINHACPHPSDGATNAFRKRCFSFHFGFVAVRSVAIRDFIFFSAVTAENQMAEPAPAHAPLPRRLIVAIIFLARADGKEKEKEEGKKRNVSEKESHRRSQSDLSLSSLVRALSLNENAVIDE